MRLVSLLAIAVLLLGVAVIAAETVWVCPMSEHTQEFSKPGTCPLCGMQLVEKNKQLQVAVLVFDHAEEIDYSGPIEVFGEAGARVFTVSPSMNVIHSVFALRVQPDYDFEHAPPSDVVIVPGGGTRAIRENEKVQQWLRERAKSSKYVLSVCNGAFIVAQAGLLDGLKATTTASRIDELTAFAPKTTVVRERVVDNGKVITTAGLSAGIDGALHVLEREYGRPRAEMVARGMEFRWQPDSPWTHAKDADMRMPDTALPDNSTFERISSNGDSQKWELTGHLHTPLSSEEALDFAAKQIVAKGWTLKESAKGKRVFARTESDGQWITTWTAADAGSPQTYLETLAIQKVR